MHRVPVSTDPARPTGRDGAEAQVQLGPHLDAGDTPDEQLIKRIKRVGYGFRNFDNYRLHLLLHFGVDWPPCSSPPPTATTTRSSASTPPDRVENDVVVIERPY
jgi:hypothetical protein